MDFLGTKRLGKLRRSFYAYNEWRRFKSLSRRHRNIVVYVESERFYPYFESIIDVLYQRFGCEVVYVTSSISDPMLQKQDSKKRSFFIGESTVRELFFAGLEANVLVMTLLDLGNFRQIKRSPHPVHYVYVPHNMTSTHMVFRKGAYDNYDSVFCVGPHQVAELRKAESLYGLKPKVLVESGYAPLDNIYKRLGSDNCTKKISTNGNRSSLTVLVAPSWGPSCLFELGGEVLFQALLDAGHSVIVRPHRGSRKNSAKVLEKLQMKFSSNRNITWENGSSSGDLYLKADIVVSDWSGAALSFAFGTERPVLFIDTPKKILNEDYLEFEIIPLEVSIRDKIGIILSLSDLSHAGTIVGELYKNRSAYSSQIRHLREKYVYNLGTSAVQGANYLFELSQNYMKY